MCSDSFLRPPCPAAWTAPTAGIPPRRLLLGAPYSACLRAYDGRAVARLLERAQLPRAELLHMGATYRLLDTLPEWVAAEVVEPLLGRIVFDATHGAGGWAYEDTPACRTERDRLGRRAAARFLR